MKHVFSRMLYCCLVLVLFINPVDAAPVDRTWDVPSIGIMKGPEGFTAVNMEQWLKELEPVLKAANEKKVDGKGVATVPTLSKIDLQSELKIYQLQVDDGKAYHTAGAFVFKDDKQIAGNIANFFATDQQEFLDAINEMLLNGIKTIEAESEKTGVVTVKILDLTTASPLGGSSEVIYSLGGRLIVDSKGMLLPLYSKYYLLNREGRLVIAGIVTTDSDGEFWKGVSDQLFESIEH